MIPNQYIENESILPQFQPKTPKSALESEQGYLKWERSRATLAGILQYMYHVYKSLCLKLNYPHVKQLLYYRRTQQVHFESRGWPENAIPGPECSIWSEGGPISST
ncbi:Hypothetical_protein [Hexamita inflata]|uniref:Hypothetical_protein n=1 Tax=Hexamita inflata TaxID=28002 RepID=A0AA86PWV0_9EUKA|nr:Hypothetical protein HINF_LOCUS33267 [Hexamita inflata]